MANVGIKNSWSLKEFSKSHGAARLAKGLVNKETGQIFSSLAFGEHGAYTFVSFSSNLGELTPQEIVAQKDKLQVVELESGSYKLCRQGENTWEEIDLL